MGRPIPQACRAHSNSITRHRRSRGWLSRSIKASANSEIVWSEIPPPPNVGSNRDTRCPAIHGHAHQTIQTIRDGWSRSRPNCLICLTCMEGYSTKVPSTGRESVRQFRQFDRSADTSVDAANCLICLNCLMCLPTAPLHAARHRVSAAFPTAGGARRMVNRASICLPSNTSRRGRPLREGTPLGPAAIQPAIT